MDDVEIHADYTFAWRWLLPAAPNVVCTGDEAVDRLLLASVRGQGDEAGVVALIDADACLRAGTVGELNVVMSSYSIAIYGSPKAVERLSRAIGLSRTFGMKNAHVSDYGLLPPSAPRVVVPLSNRASALQGLSLHNPGSRHGQWAVWVLRRLTAWGFLAPLKGKMLRIASSAPVQPWVLRNSSFNVLPGDDYALYLGAKGSNRKTVALPVNPQQAPERVIKTAEQSIPRIKLANEAIMLKRLAETPLAIHVPALYSFHENDSATIIVQEYRSVEPIKALQKQQAAIEFLNLMHSTGTTWVSLGDMIADEAPERTVHIKERRDTLRFLKRHVTGLPVPIGLVHGDFAPWNCGLAAGRLLVYDWEEGDLKGLLLDDAFSYAVLPLILVHHIKDTHLLAQRAIDLAKSLRVARTLDPRVIRACLVYWSLRRPAYFFPEIFTQIAVEVSDGL
ncbi:phosphotransferase [Ideonella alba]|uniref:Aminoglycoside phosphotransferase domain-containing protein n=1 Tax=Ideonella alba TaxID=2824118 RepID=A0A941BF92_9BURK|nr:hypothetical protein [Ideonella alba]MBQ0929178.1 hypothetical protein [Ideonella alba]